MPSSKNVRVQKRKLTQIKVKLKKKKRAGKEEKKKKKKKDGRSCGKEINESILKWAGAAVVAAEIYDEWKVWKLKKLSIEIERVYSFITAPWAM